MSYHTIISLLTWTLTLQPQQSSSTFLLITHLSNTPLYIRHTSQLALLSPIPTVLVQLKWLHSSLLPTVRFLHPLNSLFFLPPPTVTSKLDHTYLLQPVTIIQIYYYSLTQYYRNNYNYNYYAYYKYSTYTQTFPIQRIIIIYILVFQLHLTLP